MKKTIRFFLMFTAIFGLGIAVQAQDNSVLVGRWIYQNPATGMRQVAMFLPDGRFLLEQEAAGTKTRTVGTYQLQGSRLNIQPHREKPEGGLGSPNGGPGGGQLQLSGDSLVYQPDLPAGVRPATDQYMKDVFGPYDFQREPGSAQKVVEEARAYDNQVAAGNAEWEGKLACGPRQAGFSPLYVGDLAGGDPNPAKVFEGAQVMQKQQLYKFVDVTQSWSIPGDREGGRSSTMVYLLPNGRCFVKIVTYPVGSGANTRYTGNVKPAVATFWGRYGIDAGRDVKFEMDNGETFAFAFEDGRRNLRPTDGKTSFVLTQIDWLIQIINNTTKAITGG